MSGRTVLLLLVVATLGACALTRGNGDAAETSTATEVTSVARRIAQLGFGHQAHFAECVEPACPTQTRKSLPASPEPIPAQLTTPTATTVPAPVPEPSRPAIPAPTPAPAPESRQLILHFALNSASLTTAHKALLRDALSGLRRSERVVIAGRTDDLGSAPLNQSLALARGLAVRDHLLSLDPALPARISIDARGRCCYAVANDDAQARAQNRRGEITYSPGSGVAR
jgi:outer membrane protein OmpA-like peptidoglycan-associated protein